MGARENAARQVSDHEVLDFFILYGDGRQYWLAILISRADGQRYAGDGPSPWVAVARSLEERDSRRRSTYDATIPPGKINCDRCDGNGYINPPPVGCSWMICPDCRGVGNVWAAGGPAFGCVHTLGDQDQGAIVMTGTGHRGRVQWHIPRDEPRITFVTLIDDFDDYESPTPTAFDSSVGVVSAAPHVRGDGLHAGEKAADAVDPLARRVIETSSDGPLV